MIKNVWASNLREEMERIMDIVDTYPYVAMDTEFPGVLARPIGIFKNAQDFHYQTLKCNVDVLKIIQLGLTFCDENGRPAPGVSTWQFNFKFNMAEDMYSQDSIDLLERSGINFRELSENGIDPREFGEVIMTSGVVLNDDLKWITFHAGYDFAYFVKLLSCQALPKDETEFFELLQIYFPCIYDLKCVARSCEALHGGLQRIADHLAVNRLGPQHQAGSDALLTAATFFKVRTEFFENVIDEKHMGTLYGLGGTYKKKPTFAAVPGSSSGPKLLASAPAVSPATTAAASSAAPRS
jgi:CCR4-NOT transcription complex subunit 7/8